MTDTDVIMSVTYSDDIQHLQVNITIYFAHMITHPNIYTALQINTVITGES